ncbi:hypothetical protein CLU79DRAFT_717355 [Phycomyces nitens]|nr:hypothetical protein CLU79DRAFT_717355 [Phycomyces nitens]
MPIASRNESLGYPNPNLAKRVPVSGPRKSSKTAQTQSGEQKYQKQSPSRPSLADNSGESTDSVLVTATRVSAATPTISSRAQHIYSFRRKGEPSIASSKRSLQKIRQDNHGKKESNSHEIKTIVEFEGIALPWTDCVAYSLPTKSALAAFDSAELIEQLAGPFAISLASEFPVASLTHLKELQENHNKKSSRLNVLKTQLHCEAMIRSALVSSLRLEHVDPSLMKQISESDGQTSMLTEQLITAFSELSDDRVSYLEHIAGTIAASTRKRMAQDHTKILPAAQQTNELDVLRSALGQLSRQLDQIVQSYITPKHQSQRTTLGVGSVSDNGSISGDSRFSSSVRTSMTSVEDGSVMRMDQEYNRTEESWEINSISEKIETIALHLATNERMVESASREQHQALLHTRKIDQLRESLEQERRYRKDLESLLDDRHIPLNGVNIKHTLSSYIDSLETHISRQASVLEKSRKEEEALLDACDRVTGQSTTCVQDAVQALLHHHHKGIAQDRLPSGPIDQNVQIVQNEQGGQQIYRNEYEINDLKSKLNTIEQEYGRVQAEHLDCQRALKEYEYNLSKSEQAFQTALQTSQVYQNQLEALQSRPPHPSAMPGEHKAILDAELNRLRSTFQEAQSKFSQREGAYMLQSASIEAELGCILKEYDRLTRNITDFKHERKTYENCILDLKQKLGEREQNLADEQAKRVGGDAGTHELRKEFRQMMAQTTLNHQAEMKSCEMERRKVEEELRDVKSMLELKHWDQVDAGVQTSFMVCVPL